MIVTVGQASLNSVVLTKKDVRCEAVINVKSVLGAVDEV